MEELIYLGKGTVFLKLSPFPFGSLEIFLSFFLSSQIHPLVNNSSICLGPCTNKRSARDMPIIFGPKFSYSIFYSEKLLFSKNGLNFLLDFLKCKSFSILGRQPENHKPSSHVKQCMEKETPPSNILL